MLPRAASDASIDARCERRNAHGAGGWAAIPPLACVPARSIAIERIDPVSGPTGDVIQLDATPDAWRRAFLAWQCRIRQIAVRDHGGRPTPGMRPLLEVAARQVGPITVVLNKRDGGETTAQFRFMVKKTHDPADRYDAALRYLAAAYYQHPDSFSDRLTALFAPEVELPAQISGRADCVLTFAQFNQRWRLPCAAQLLEPDAAEYQATYWHNALFNPRLPGNVRIVAFTPDWTHAEAGPPPV
jgi:hypothetical protein